MNHDNLLYSYDLHRASVGRDRNSVSTLALQRQVGLVWSQHIVRKGPAKFLNQLLPAIQKGFYGVEYHALRHLTSEARDIIAQAMSPAIPVHAENLREAQTLFKCVWKVVPNSFAAVDIAQMIENEKVKLTMSPLLVENVPEDLERLVAPLKLYVRNCPESPLNFIPSCDGTLVVNGANIEASKLTLFVLLRVIPYCYKDSDELPPLSIQWKPQKLTIVMPTRTEGEEAPPVRKRSREEEEEAEPKDAPDGYEWIHGWTCVKKNRN